MNILAACMQAEPPSRAKLMFYLQTTHCKYAAESIFSPLSVQQDIDLWRYTFSGNHAFKPKTLHCKCLLHNKIQFTWILHLYMLLFSTMSEYWDDALGRYGLITSDPKRPIIA